MRSTRILFRAIGVLCLAAIMLVTSSAAPHGLTAQTAGRTERRHATTSGRVVPIPARSVSSATPLSRAKLIQLQRKHLQRREAITARVDNNPPGSEAGLPAVRGRETGIGGASEFHGTPGALTIGRNNRNTRATSGSTLAEPSAVNDGINVFYGGNTHAEFSTNGGSTWTAVTIPAGPADAPTAIGDVDVIYDRARGVTFWSMLYVNSSLNNGVVRVFVRRTIPGADSCSFDIDPGGLANNVLPDYPHLGLSNDFLYLTTNNLGATSWVGAQLYRFNIDQMADCVTTSFNVLTYTGAVGQRVFVPVEGAHETMYWGALEDTTTFRIFSWPESTTVVSSLLRTITASSFTNPDCRGGTGNFDWIERPTSFSITGFRLRGAVGAGNLSFYWNVGPDASHTQGHVHSAVFRESNLSLLAQPHIFNSGFCFGFPAVSVNDRGDLGLTIAAGGQAGGLGTAAQGFVGIDDDFTAGAGVFGTVFRTASGTRNRFDSRYGDYFTIRRQTPCGLYFAATNYALTTGIRVPEVVNARYVEFGRGRDSKCYTGWRDKVRTP